jgi:hypothetical protein
MARRMRDAHAPPILEFIRERPSNDVQRRVLAASDLIWCLRRFELLSYDLQSLHTERDVDRAIQVLVDRVESYLHAVHATRERALALVSLITRRELDDLRTLNKKKREKAVQALRPAAPNLVGTLKRILDDTNADIDQRNAMIHEALLSMVYCVGSTWFDPIDCLNEPGLGSEERARLEALFLSEVRRHAERYRAKAMALTDLIRAFQEKVEEPMRP